MCSSDLGIDKKTHPAYTLLRKGRWPETQKFFWSEITKLLPNLVYCQFAGGEPLLLPHHFEMLQKAIDLGHSKKITLRYNTNATQCPEHVFDLWKEFALVHLDLSIDDIGSRFEYQRNGAKWQDVQQNVEKFNKVRSSKIKTQMSTAINILNVLYLPEICDWYDTQNFDSLWLNVVWGPSELCVANMTAEAKELVLKKLCNWDFKQHQWQVDPVIELLRNGQTVDNTAFVEKIKKLDRLRNQDLALAHQEIANAMGYVLQ